MTYFAFDLTFDNNSGINKIRASIKGIGGKINTPGEAAGRPPRGGK